MPKKLSLSIFFFTIVFNNQYFKIYLIFNLFYPSFKFLGLIDVKHCIPYARKTEEKSCNASQGANYSVNFIYQMLITEIL